MKMYCITIFNDHYEKIDQLGYIPVGLGKKIKNTNFLNDYDGKNISHKNEYYGEYTFHYWLWKNKIRNLSNEWIGFCQYRKYWSLNNNEKKYKSFKDFKNSLISTIPKEYENYESILGEPLFINKLKLTKFIKKDFKGIITNPSLLLNKKKRHIKFHFDLMHGNGNLERAILLLNQKDQDDFYKFVTTEVSFNPHNMFICRSNKIIEEYYNAIFPWLEKCESYFGFNLEGYGLKRIYGFLAERYMSYWFKKYTNYKVMPIIFKDISDFV